MNKMNNIKVGQTYRIRTSNGVQNVKVTDIVFQNRTYVVKWTSDNGSGLTLLSGFVPVTE